jgi:hypothetical protein
MDSRSTVTYTAVIAALQFQLRAHNWEPMNLMIDFEVAIKKAFKERFPNIAVYYCKFHWAQAIRKKMKSCTFFSSTLFFVGLMLMHCV